MKKFNLFRLIVLFSLILVILTTVITCSAVIAPESGAPFSIEVDPEKLSAKAGDEVTYQLRIVVEEGFNGSIELELEVTALGYSVTFDLETQNPPYPKEFEYSFTIPSDIPVGVTAEGVLRGTSGEHVQEEHVEISIQSSGDGGGILGWLLQLISNLWNSILSLFGF